MNECVNALGLPFTMSLMMMSLMNDKTFKGAGQRSDCRITDKRVTSDALGRD